MRRAMPRGRLDCRVSKRTSRNYNLASSRLEKAYVLLNVPSLGLWSARALAKRSLLVEAANRYYEVTSLQLRKVTPPFSARPERCADGARATSPADPQAYHPCRRR